MQSHKIKTSACGAEEACFISHNRYNRVWGGVSCPSETKHAHLTKCAMETLRRLHKFRNYSWAGSTSFLYVPERAVKQCAERAQHKPQRHWATFISISGHKLLNPRACSLAVLSHFKAGAVWMWRMRMFRLSCRNISTLWLYLCCLSRMKMSSFRHIQLSENDSKLLNFNETNQASERLAAEAAVEAEVISGRSGWWSSFIKAGKWAASQKGSNSLAVLSYICILALMHLITSSAH